MLDSCPKPGKIEALKMLDLQTKSSIQNLYYLQSIFHFGNSSIGCDIKF